MVVYLKGIRGRALMVKLYLSCDRILNYYNLLSLVTSNQRVKKKILILNSFKTTYIILDQVFCHF